MAKIMNMPVDSLDRRSGRKEKFFEDPQSPQQEALAPLSPAASLRRCDRDERDRGKDDRDLDRPPSRRLDYYDRNRSPPPPAIRERDYKRRGSLSPPPPFRDRRHSPPRRSPPPPFKRSRREDGGYDGRRGSPRGRFGEIEALHFDLVANLNMEI